MRRLNVLLLGITLPVQLAAQTTQQYELTGQTASVFNLAGTVQIEAASGGGVQVEVARGGADAGKLQIDADGGTLRVRYPGDRIRYSKMDHDGSTSLRVEEDGSFGDHHGDGRRVRISREEGDLEAWADLRVAVPAGRSLDLHLAVGRISASNVNGRLRIQAAAAPVTVTGGEGDLSVSTGSGDVRLSGGKGAARLSTGSGDIELSSRNGDVSAETGSGAVTGSGIESTRLRAETGSGEIRLSGIRAPDLALHTGSGDVTLELGSAVQLLNVETGSGDVSIVAPSGIDAKLEIETGSGDIESDFPLSVTRSGRHHLIGTIGDGRGRVSVETGSGGVRLLKAKGA
jgi:lia operon protein LiaG